MSITYRARDNLVDLLRLVRKNRIDSRWNLDKSVYDCRLTGQTCCSMVLVFAVALARRGTATRITKKGAGRRLLILLTQANFDANRHTAREEGTRETCRFAGERLNEAVGGRQILSIQDVESLRKRGDPAS